VDTCRLGHLLHRDLGHALPLEKTAGGGEDVGVCLLGPSLYGRDRHWGPPPRRSFRIQEFLVPERIPKAGPSPWSQPGVAFSQTCSSSPNWNCFGGSSPPRPPGAGSRPSALPTATCSTACRPARCTRA